LRIGRLLGVPVVVAPSWLLVAAALTALVAPTVDARVPGLGGGRFVVALAFAVLLYVSVLVHEAAHAAVALRLGLPVRRITVHFLGGVAEVAAEPGTPARAAALAGVGPVVSGVIGGIAWSVAAALPDGTVIDLLAWQLGLANLALAAFNAFPALPLDGGHVFAALVWRVSGRRDLGWTAAGWAGRGLAAFVALSALGRMAGAGLDSVTALWAAFLAWFLWSGAGQAMALGRRLRVARRVTLTGQVRPLARAASGTTLDAFAAAAFAAGMPAGTPVVVVDPAGRPLAVVDPTAAAAVPPHRRPFVTLDMLARPVVAPITADATGDDLLAALVADPGPGPGARLRLVVDPAGRVLGWVDPEAVLAAAESLPAAGR
jgi:Zn-dependent protease